MNRRDLLRTGMAAIAGLVAWPFVKPVKTTTWDEWVGTDLAMTSGDGFWMSYNGEVKYVKCPWRMEDVS